MKLEIESNIMIRSHKTSSCSRICKDLLSWRSNFSVTNHMLFQSQFQAAMRKEFIVKKDLWFASLNERRKYNIDQKRQLTRQDNPKAKSRIRFNYSKIV